MGLHRVSAGEYQRVGGAEVEDIGEETLVKRVQLHAAAAPGSAARGNSGKASSQTSRM